MGSDLRCAECLAFPFQRRVSGEAGARAGANLLRVFLECVCGGRDAFDSRSRAQGLYRCLCPTWEDASGLGLLRVVAAISNGVRAALKDEAEDAGIVDRRREVVRQSTWGANEIGVRQCHGHHSSKRRPLDSGRKAKRNHRRASKFSLTYTQFLEVRADVFPHLMMPVGPFVPALRAPVVQMMRNAPAV